MSWLGRLFRALILRLLTPAIFLAVGWYAGATYGAPDFLLRAADGVVRQAQSILSPLVAEGVERSGDYVVGTVEQMLDDFAEPSDSDAESGKDNQDDAADPSAEETSGSAPETGDGAIVLCQIRVSNAPRGGQPGSSIGRADETVRYKGVSLLLMPATKACLSSGYGYRSGRLHRGVDYFSDQGGDVLAAGDGVILEAVFRSDYGNMVVIDHGNGVYTRYAHLARFAGGVREGATVNQGDILGPIGNTGYSNIVHLHYELLTGDYNTNAKSFGLETVDPFNV